MARRKVRSRDEETRRFGQPQCRDRQQDEREGAPDDEDHRPSKALVQHGDQEDNQAESRGDEDRTR
jgi:hypothetical protein